MDEDKMLDKNKKAIVSENVGGSVYTRNAKIFALVFAVLLLGVTLFILINSLLDFETSHQSSGAIVDVILPDDVQDVVINDKSTEFYFRKTIHFVEYCALGFCALSLMCFLSKFTPLKRSFIGESLLFVLFIAVFDEHLQSLSDRSSSTFDILLDFAGGIFGIFLSFMIFYVLVNKIEKKRAASLGVSTTK